MSSSDEYDGRSHRMRTQSQRPQYALRRIRRGRARIQVLQAPRQPAIQARRDRHLQHVARARSRRAVVGEEVGPERRFHELRPALVRLVEQRRDARFDQVPEPLEPGDVLRRKSESPGSVGHRRRAHRVRDRTGQGLELLFELGPRDRRCIRMPA